MKYWIALLWLVLPAIAAGDSTGSSYEIVNSAFDAIDRRILDEWAFTETSSTKEVTLIARYDPRREDQRWILQSVDGREPTADETSDFLEEKARRQPQNGDDQADDHDQRVVVKFETLELVEETDDYWIFSFVPNDDEDEDDESRQFMAQIDGTVKIVRDGHYVEYIDLRNDAPVRPALSVKINRFVMHMTFGPASAEGPIVPLTVDVEVKGRAFLVVKIDDVESIRYSDYEYAGP